LRVTSPYLLGDTLLPFLLFHTDDVTEPFFSFVLVFLIIHRIPRLGLSTLSLVIYSYPRQLGCPSLRSGCLGMQGQQLQHKYE